MLRLWTLGLVLTSHLCAAQVTGYFSLDKTAYAVGEPVFLSFTLSNDGKQPINVSTTDPYSFCSGYQIHIERQGEPNVACLEQSLGGSCLSGQTTLQPRGTRTEQILLNFQNDSRGELNPPVRAPGQYTISAARAVGYSPVESNVSAFEGLSYEVHQTLTLRVDEALEVKPSIYGSFVKQLSSPDNDIRRNAARTLATLAPASLESLLLTFPDSKDYAIRQEAPLALANLDTEKSLAALAEMLTHNPSGSYESMASAENLGQTHDAKWLPLLLDVADKQGSMYLRYAAESGGELAIPFLLNRMRSTKAGDRSNAISAMGATGSQKVVPLLISLLNPTTGKAEDGWPDDALSAEIALQQLTHYYVLRDETNAWLKDARGRWQSWWNMSGQNAKIYRPRDCAQDRELP